MESLAMNEVLSERITKFYLMHRSVLKSLMKVGKMPLAQYHILSLLSEYRSMRMGEISQMMAISRPNLTPLVDKLVAMGYVERAADERDRRVTYISITEGGEQALARERSLILESVSHFTEKLAEEDCVKLSEALEMLNGIATHMTELR